MNHKWNEQLMIARKKTFQWVLGMLLPVFFSCPLLVGFAQQHSQFQLSLYGGMQLMSERDKGFSPLLHRGSSAYIGGEFRLEKVRSDMAFTVTFGEGGVENRYGKEWNIDSYTLLVSNYYKNNAGQRYRWGWSNLNTFNQRVNSRFVNFNYRSEYFTAFGPCLNIHNPFTWNKMNLLWENMAHMQMFGFVIASDYVLSEPRGVRNSNGISNFFQMMDPFLIGRDWAIGGSSQLSCQMGSGNSLGIQYRYDFQQLATIHPVQRSRGAVLLFLTVLL